MKKILTFTWVTLFILSRPLFAEEVQGSVRFVDLIEKSVTIAPMNPGQAGGNRVYLQTENATLEGIGSLGDLEIGDEIIAEGNKAENGKMDVQDLKLASKSKIDSLDNNDANHAETSAPKNSKADNVQKSDTAAPAPVHYNAGKKLIRGLLNIVSSPVEITRSIQTASNQENMAYGWTVGLFLGIGECAMRLGTGLFDTVTFPFNFPKHNKGPLLEPEFVWENPGVKYI